MTESYSRYCVAVTTDDGGPHVFGDAIHGDAGARRIWYHESEELVVLGGVRTIELLATVESIEVPSATAVPVGLIVNELVTNAFKYAFPDGRHGRIRISVTRMDNGRAQLIVADDGIGLIQEGSRQGLGTRLTDLLCRQLDGSIQREAGNPGCRVVADVRLELA